MSLSFKQVLDDLENLAGSDMKVYLINGPTITPAFDIKTNKKINDFGESLFVLNPKAKVVVLFDLIKKLKEARTPQLFVIEDNKYCEITSVDRSTFRNSARIEICYKDMDSLSAKTFETAKGWGK